MTKLKQAIAYSLQCAKRQLHKDGSKTNCWRIFERDVFIIDDSWPNVEQYKDWDASMGWTGLPRSKVAMNSTINSLTDTILAVFGKPVSISHWAIYRLILSEGSHHIMTLSDGVSSHTIEFVI